jgi:rhodanese-related sulfurtransferase
MVAAIEPERLAELLSSDPEGILLLDVREHDERKVARIEPSLHIPMGEIKARRDEIPAGRRLVVLCHHGGRASTVAGFLELKGRRDVMNLVGGIDAWSRRVDAKVPRYT